MSNEDSTLPAAKCIDGDKTTKTVDNLCHSNRDANERAPWLALDFGASDTSVERVDIFNRADCCGERLKNVEVRVANELPTDGSQMFSGGSLFDKFDGPGFNGQHIIIPGKCPLLMNRDHYQYFRSSQVRQICHYPNGQC